MDSKLVPVADPKSEDSIVISVVDDDQVESPSADKGKQRRRWLPECPCCGPMTRFLSVKETRWMIHGVKVGLALVLVSLLYMLEVVHDRLGDNAMWAVMTVVVVFEFTAGATISKGVNRGAGTILGAGLGTLVALLAQEIGGVGKAVVVGTSVFVFGAPATYFRMVPKIKKKYDYGAVIFILTFNLVAISGVRVDEIIKIASDRLTSITLGFLICLFVSLFVFPTWAGDELHNSLVSKFEILGHLIEVCSDYKSLDDKKRGTQTGDIPCRCSPVLSSKNTDEALANFARWEPRHGKFGFYYPWSKYLQMGELLRELAPSILSLKQCLESKQPSSVLCWTMDVKERCESSFAVLVCTMRELQENIYNMKQCQKRDIILANLQMIKMELCSQNLVPTPTITMDQSGIMHGEVTITNILLLVMNVVDKMEELVKEVEELGKIAGFSTR